MIRTLGFAAAMVAMSSTMAFAAGDATKGATIFNRCAICHSNTKGAPNKIGPNLFGVVGRKAGTVEGFSYSAAMKNSGIVWTEDKLEAYVQHPPVVVPGNRMTFAGLSTPEQADDLVAYLVTLK